jgi:hypothetical protein
MEALAEYQPQIQSGKITTPEWHFCDRDASFDEHIVEIHLRGATGRETNAKNVSILRCGRVAPTDTIYPLFGAAGVRSVTQLCKFHVDR